MRTDWVRITCSAFVLAASGFTAQPATSQDFEGEGQFIDGEWVEGYVYVPDFMSPQELKRHIDAGSEEIVIVDTAAELIFEEERIPGAINYPWVAELALPVPLPRDKTLVVYCACNDHEDSVDMAAKLSQAGYLDVKVLEGGWFEWLDLEYDIAGLAAEE
jgi:rhodanese-related sulfurtransferase